MSTSVSKIQHNVSEEEQLRIEQLLEKINSKIKENALETNDPALMYGKSGMLIFLCYYQRYKGTVENEEIIQTLLEHIFESLQTEQDFGYHFAGGLTGVFWTIRHLANQELIDPEILEGLTETENQFLAPFISHENERRNYDLFYGTMGAGLLLLERKDPDKELLQIIFQGLLEMKKDFFYGTGFEDPIPYIRKDKEEDFEEDGRVKEVYNLGMAHGSPSIMTFTALLNQGDYVPKADIVNLINRVDSFMSFHKMEPGSPSTYPIWFQPSDPDPFPSRLSWCYGDLSIACGYGLMGQKLDNTGFTRYADKLGRSTEKRNTMSTAKLFDACLCHGSGGNMHMYSRLYEYTQNETFAELSNQWSEIGLEIHAQSGNNVFTYYDAENFSANYSFLEGLAGTGLAYLARIDKNHSPDWDRILLLS